MTIAPKETITKSVEQRMREAFAFGHAALAEPALLDETPEGDTILFFPGDDAATIEAGIELGLREVRQRQTVTFRFVTPEELAAWEAAGAAEREQGRDAPAAPRRESAAKSA